MEMGLGVVLVMYAFVVGFMGLVLKWVMKNVNKWIYETKLGDKQYSLPPGDLGWPFIGNMWSFLSAFKSQNPETFLSSFISRSLSLSLDIYKSLLYDIIYYIIFLSRVIGIIRYLKLGANVSTTRLCLCLVLMCLSLYL